MGLTLFMAIAYPSALIFAAYRMPQNVFNGLAMILLLAVIVGLIMPNMVVSWLIIMLTTIGAAFLLLGYVVMAPEAKFLLLIAFPVEAALTLVLHGYLLQWSFIRHNRRDIEHYISHFNSDVKLLTNYTANKVYSKIIKNIQDYPELHLWMHVEMTHWANSEQFRQYHPTEYSDFLRKIARILKTTRLAAENIYYLGDGTFLVISPELRDNIVQKINQKTKKDLEILDKQMPGAIKWTQIRIDEHNATRFADPDVIEKHMRRELETDLVVEYLKDDTNE